MRQLKLGIVGMESNYVIGLMNYINADKRNPIFAMAFSTEERLESYLKEHALDALLYEESMMAVITGLSEGKSICTIRLTEQEPDKMEKEAIYRYLNVEEILKQVMRIIKAEEAEGKRELFETYAVISPIGRSGKTRLAKSICLMDEVRGGLYIGMEAYGERKPETVSDKTCGMSELAYLIRIRSEQIFEYLDKSVTVEGGIGVVASPEVYLDLRELNRADVSWFIKKLIAYGRYTTIVFDIDGSVLGDITILGEFDHVFVPVLDGGYAEAKVAAFQRLLEKQELQKVVMRMQQVVVPDLAYDSAEMMQLAGRLVGT